MAVEIKEIVIRAVLSDQETKGSPAGSSALNKDEFLQECVDQVLKVLEKKKRR